MLWNCCGIIDNATASVSRNQGCSQRLVGKWFFFMTVRKLPGVTQAAGLVGCFGGVARCGTVIMPRLLVAELIALWVHAYLAMA